MKYIAIALSEVGKIRKNNEDNLFFDGEFRDFEDSSGSYRKTLSSQDPVKLFALCDGMGGEAMGEQASYMAVSGLKEIERHFIQDQGKSFPKLMPRYLARVNESLCQIIRNNKGRRMGSTFASLLLKANVAQALNVGDSRIYLFRHGKLNQLSVDHTYAQRLVEMGIITQEEAAQHPERNRLSQHLGMFPEEAKIEPAFSPEIWLQAGDSFLICTDGVTEMLSETSISEILRSPQAFLQQAENLMQHALAAGGKDNISLILIKIQELNDEQDDSPLPEIKVAVAPVAISAEADPVPSTPVATSSYRDMPEVKAPELRENVRAKAELEKPAIENLPDAANRATPAMEATKATAVVVEPALSKGGSYELSEDEVARFEEARKAALERQQALKGDTLQQGNLAVRAQNGKVGQGLQNAGARRNGEDPRKRKARGPSTGHIIGRALMLFLLFSVIGAALIFVMMNIDVLLRFIRKIIGG